MKIAGVKWKKQKMIKGISAISCIVLMFLFYLSVACDFGFMKSPMIDLLVIVRPESKENIVYAFNTLWSVAVTVTIFVLEISEKYKYGVPLKRVIVEALGNRWIFAGATIFLALFPLFFFCMKFSLMQIGLWCLCAAFVMFTETIAFFVWMYKGCNIRDVVRAKTVEQILDLIGEKQKRRWKKRKSNQGKLRSIHMQIDGLAISSMLDYADYGNADEVGGLVDMCQKIFKDSKMLKKLFESTLGNLMITTWVDHIIHSCRWDTEYDCTQNINTLCSLWNGIVAVILNSDINENLSSWRTRCHNADFNSIQDRDEAIVSVCLQFLQPFVNENNLENDRILVRIWQTFGIHKKQVLVYLLLYTTYLTHRFERLDYAWFLRNELAVHICMQEIMKGYFWWNEKFAIKCWLDWSQYEGYENVNLAGFMQFSNDMRSLQSGKRYEVKSPIIIRAVGGIK